MSINRRQILRVAGQGIVAIGAQTGLGLSAALAADKEPEEEKKKSTLVSNVEEFGRGSTRVAVLLPNIDGPYRFAADAVLRGVMAAHATDGRGVRVKVVRIEDPAFPDASEVYRQMQRDRISMVIGPLIRSEVNGLSAIDQLPIPTLGLNLPDQGQQIPGNCTLFSLAVEFDGRSAARYAFAEAYQRVGSMRAPWALTISNTSELSQRSAAAFTEAWQANGGQVDQPIVRDVQTYDEMTQLLAGVRADVVFAALDAEVMRTIRPAFAASLPIYGTSQLNVGALPTVAKAELLAAPELDGVRVVEMPWQLHPDHPAVAAYPRSRRLPNLEMQRLYAFGIDAWRLSRALMKQADDGLTGTPFTLDGVTGQLYLDANQDPRVLRESVLGVYRQGILQPAYASGPGGYEQAPAGGSSPRRP